MTDSKKQSSSGANLPQWGAGIAIGIAIGIALGTALGNIGVGIAIGMGIGVAFAIAFGEAARRRRPDDTGDADRGRRDGS